MQTRKILISLFLICIISLSATAKNGQEAIAYRQIPQADGIYKEKKNVYKVLELLDTIKSSENAASEKQIFKISSGGKFGLLLVDLNKGQDGQVDFQTKIIEKPKYIFIQKTEQPFYYKVKNGGHWGIIRVTDPNNIMNVVPIKYEDVSVFPNETYKVKKNGKFGLFQAGTFVLPPEYISIDLLSVKPHKYMYYKIAAANGKKGICASYDHNFKIVAEPTFDNIELFYEESGFYKGSTFKVLEHNKYGLFSIKDLNFKKELDLLYDKIELLAGKNDKQFAKIVNQGKVLVVCIYPAEEHKIVILSECEFDDIKLLENETDIYCKVLLRGRYGLMQIYEKQNDKQKYRLVLQPIYDDILYDKNINEFGLFGLYTDGLYGFYDANTQNIIAPVYNYEIIGQAANQMFKAKKDDKIIMMDPYNNIVYDHDEFQRLNINTYKTRVGNKWGIVNAQNELPAVYDDVIREVKLGDRTNAYIVNIGGKLALVDSQSRLIVPPESKYEDIKIENGSIYYFCDNQWQKYIKEEKGGTMKLRTGIIGN